MKYFFRERSLTEQIKKYKKILLVLDFDGTLSPIVAKPHYAKISPQFRNTLLKFKHSENVYIAIISGRPVSFLKSLINLDFVYYSGNHGIEIKGPGMNFLCRGVKNNEKIILKVCEHLKSVFGRMSGIIIENKGFSVALHYRCLKAGYEKDFRNKISQIKKEFSALPVLWKKGHKVLEFLPETSCNKGTAVQNLVKNFKNIYPIAIGDDDTDEDMFKILKNRGIAIRIKRKKNSHAQFYLRNQREVLKVIKLIYNLKTHNL